MNLSPLLMLAVCAALILAINGGQPIAVEPGDSSSFESPLYVRLLLPRTAAETPAAAADPFFGTAPIPLPDPPAGARAALAAPALPPFRIVGKQQDDTGWSVFVATPDPMGPVWTVREGENFGDAYRLTRLAPPIAVIQRIGSRQSRTYDIGKDEE